MGDEDVETGNGALDSSRIKQLLSHNIYRLEMEILLIKNQSICIICIFGFTDSYFSFDYIYTTFLVVLLYSPIITSIPDFR